MESSAAFKSLKSHLKTLRPQSLYVKKDSFSKIFFVEVGCFEI